MKSTDDERIVNNTLKHQYRVLTEEEKAQVEALKAAGQEFLDLLEAIGSSRELAIAKTNLETAVMWSVKHVTR